MTTANKRKESIAMTGVVITADHVYLPVSIGENVVEAWPAPNVSTSKVLRGTRLQVPPKLARFLCFRGQAEAVTAEASANTEGA